MTPRIKEDIKKKEIKIKVFKNKTIKGGRFVRKVFNYCIFSNCIFETHKHLEGYDLNGCLIDNCFYRGEVKHLNIEKKNLEKLGSDLYKILTLKWEE